MRSIILVFSIIFIISFSCKAQKGMIPKVNDGTIERISMMKSEFVSPRNIDVWLPSDYDPSKRYSVLYMNDGQTLFDP
ncbi:MAG TPA: esterase, partial [Bacteroidetes bacterium]|nr:esterase [Bacteroidota bacterium]